MVLVWICEVIAVTFDTSPVIANEIRSLAAKSAEAAQNTNNLINCSIQDIKTGTESTNLAVSAMQVINDCIQAIKTLMDEIAIDSVQLRYFCLYLKSANQII